MKRLLSLIVTLCMVLLAFPVTVSAAEESKTLTFTQMHGYYRSLGRTVEHNSCLYMDNVASGFEVYLHGSGDVILGATVLCNADYGKAEQYFLVRVDGKETRLRVSCDSKNTHTYKSITLASGLAQGDHHIEVYRQTEAQISLCRAETLTFTGHLLSTPPEKPLTIDVIGDSISAGYGCLWNSSLGVTAPNGNDPAYEDGTQTYAFLAGKALGADVRVTQTSGYGCVAGWNGRDVNLQTMYPLTCYWRSNTFAHDFTPPADVVVINLGTNDYNTRNNNNMSNAEFKAGAINLMKMAKEYNQGAPVVWCTGMMGTFYRTELEAAVAELGGAAAGYYFLVLPQGMGGAVSHPTAAQQAAAGEVLADFLLGTILPDDYTAARTTTSALQAAVGNAKAVASPSAALQGAIARAEMELAVGTTDGYRLGARLDDLNQALANSEVKIRLMPDKAITKAPTAADGVSYVWPYYATDDGSVGLYKGGDGFYWPCLTTSYVQTIDIDETPYLTMDFVSTAAFNVSLSYLTKDNVKVSVNASTLAGIQETDFPARLREKTTVDFAAYIRQQGHADSEGMVSLVACDIFVIGETDQAVRLYDCAFTNVGTPVVDDPKPNTITGQITINNGCLAALDAGTSAADLLGMMDNSNYLCVQDQNGNTVNDRLATGMKLVLRVDGVIVDQAVIIITGDVSGDGSVTSVDARETLLSLLGAGDPLSDIAALAADATKDGTLSTTDVRAMLTAILA